jgi:protease PrsW
VVDGHRTPIDGSSFAPHTADMTMTRRFGWVAVLLDGVAIFELVRQTLIRTQNPNFVPALLLIGATVVPTAFVTFWWGRRLA